MRFLLLLLVTALVRSRSLAAAPLAAASAGAGPAGAAASGAAQHVHDALDRLQHPRRLAEKPAAPATSALHDCLYALAAPEPRSDAAPSAAAAAASALPAAAIGEAPRRFLVFTYSPEQRINGFAAMFQWYAAALVLAQRYDRMLVELHAPPPPPPPPLTLGPRLSAAASAAAAAANASLRHAASAHNTHLFRTLARVNDPWQRAPLAACGGAKAGCFFEPPASCGLAILPADIAARVRCEALPGNSTCGTAHALANDAHGDAAAADRLIEGAVPLLDIAAEERRLLQQRPQAVQPDRAAHSSTGAEPIAAAEALVVRVDAIAHYRHATLRATAGLAPLPRRNDATDAREHAPALSATLRQAVEDSCYGSASAADVRAFGAWEGSSTTSLTAEKAPTAVQWYCRNSTDAITGRVRRNTNAAFSNTQTVSAWQRLWFPAFQSFLFKPRTFLTATDSALSQQATRQPQPQPQQQQQPPPQHEQVVGVHYRSGDAALLSWRSHAPLADYTRQALQAAALLGASNWTLALATDSLSARASLNESIHAEHARIIFEASLEAATEQPHPLRPTLPARTAGGTLTLPIPAAGSRQQLVTRGAHVHLESWIHGQQEAAAAAFEEMQRARPEAASAGGELDAAYMRHLALTSAPLPAPAGAAYELRVFPIEAQSFPILEAALAQAHAARSAAEAALSESLALPGESARRAELCAVLHSLDDDIGRAASDSIPTPHRSSRSGVCRTASAAADVPQPLAHISIARAIATLTSSVVAEIAALSSSAAIIGTCLSQVSRIAVDLSYATGVARLPPVGMDAASCPNAPHPYAILADWRPPRSK